MELLKNKWNNFTVYRKLNSLWGEYKQVSHLQNHPDALKKLNAFLDHAQEAFKSYISNHQKKQQIEDIIRDSSEIFNTLLRYALDYEKNKIQNENLDLLNKMLNQCLEIIEYILREEKYRKQIENSPALILDFLNLFEKVENNNSKVIIIKFLVMISENTDSKLVFAQKDGFAKLLNLVLDKDPMISRTISKAILHFMQTRNSEDQDILDKIDEQIPEAQKQDFQGLKQKIKKIASEFKSFTFQEINRVFQEENALNRSLSPKHKGSLDNPGGANDLFRSNTTPLKLNHSELLDGKRVIPSLTYNQIFEIDLLVLQSIQQEDLNNEKSTQDDEQILESVNDPGNAELIQKLLQARQKIPDDGNPAKLENSELFKKVEILKMGLRQIFDMIEVASQDVQIDLMSTLAEILHLDNKYQNEFKKLNGYILVEKIFLEDRDFEDENQIQFVESLYELLELMVTNNHHDQALIANQDAYKMLISLLERSDNFDILLRTLDQIERLLYLNWKNIVVSRRLKIFNKLISLVRRVHGVSPKESIQKYARFIYKNSLNQESKQLERQALTHEQTDLLLEKVQGVLKIFVESEKFYSADFFYLLQEQLIVLLDRKEQNDPTHGQIVDQVEEEIWRENLKSLTHFLMNLLITSLEGILDRRCQEVITLDHLWDKAIKKFVEIFQILTRNLTHLNQRYFCHILRMLHHCLVCDHRHEYSAPSTQDSQGQQQNPVNILKLMSKNICREVAEYFKQMFRKNILKYEDIGQIIRLFRMSENKQSQEVEIFDLVIQILTIVKDCLVQNDQTLQGFIAREGQQMFAYVLGAQLQKNEYQCTPEQLQDIAGIFLDLAVCRFESVRLLTNPLRREKVPLNRQNLGCLNSLLVFLAQLQEWRDEDCLIFDALHQLLLDQSNLDLVLKHDVRLLDFLLDRLSLNVVSSQTVNLYTSALSVIELILPRLGAESMETFIEQLFNGEMVKRCNKTHDVQFLADILSLIGVHLLLGGQQNFAEKILNHLFNFLAFLEAGNYQVREMALKFTVIVHSSLTLSGTVKKCDKFVRHNAAFYKLIHKLIEQSPSIIDEKLCQTIYDLIYWIPEKVTAIYPSNTSVVCTLMNRSESGAEIIKFEKLYESKMNSKDQQQPVVLTASKDDPPEKGQATPIKKITNPEIVEIFLAVLKSFGENQEFKTEILRVFRNQINEQNAGILVDYPNIFLHLFNFVKPIQNPFQEELPSFNAILYEIIQVILDYDFQRKSARVVTEHFKRFHEDATFLQIIIEQFLNNLIEKPSLKSENAQNQSNFLKNLHALFSSLDEFLPQSAHINILIIQCINRLTQKNQGQVRTLMKSLGIFEIRDNILVQIIRNAMTPETLLRILDGVSFESLSTSNKFREQHVIASLIRILIVHKDDLRLQILIMKILKHDIIAQVENKKYVAKLLGHPALIYQFYQDLNIKKSGIAKCFSSYQLQEQNQLDHESEDPEPEVNPAAQSHSNKSSQSGNQNSQKLENEDKTAAEDQQLKSNILKGNSLPMDVFLNEFHGPIWEFERKQIILRIEQALLPIETESKKQQNKLQQKIQVRKGKLIEQFSSDIQGLYQKINEAEQRIGQKLAKATEKMKLKTNKYLDFNTSLTNKGAQLYQQMISN